MMTSREELMSVLADVDPCHFPSLVYDHDTSPTNETYSSWLSLPKIAQQESATQALSRDDLCKFAFALLLKTYIRTDSASCGLVTGSQSNKRDASRPSMAHLVRMDFDVATTILNNLKKMTSIPLTGSDGEMIGRHFREIETQAGFKHFNTTLCLTHFGPDEEQIENVFDSEMVLRVESGTSDVDSNDQVKVTLHYSTNLLDKWCAQNLVYTFENILSTITTNIDCLLESVKLISTRDEQLIYTWNAKVPPPAHQTLNEHFEKVFRENVDKEVVYTSDGCFTYGELDDLSTVLAVRLVQAGLKQNMVVPICMNKSRWGTCAMTAVWKAGGALTTMDPTHPDDRLFAIMEELGAKIVISDTTHASRFEKAGVQVISDLDNLPRLLESSGLPISRADAWRIGNVRPDDLAFVAFTSGSSGRPKGVMHTHDRLTSEHLSYGWNVEYNGGARILQFASYAYIASVGENFRTLLHSATLCVPSETERTSNLAEFINQSRSTRSYMTPSLIRTINPKDVPSLKHLVVGGEPVGRDLEKLWAGHVHFIHLYGASEGGFMIKETSNPQYQGKGLLPIGGLSWLVDPRDVDKLVPIGAVGEIVFESHELAAGYLNDPEKTAKTFIDAPVWAQNRDAARGCRYLRMGDLGRYETDGSMSIYGRADTQVKIHGQRVELQDIESNLRILLPPESEAIVELVKPFDAPDRPLLTAFCRFKRGNASNGDSDSDPDVRQVISNSLNELKRVLPQHMVPRAFIVVGQLPQNSSNKIDRRKLRADASRLGYKHLIASSLGAGNEHLECPANEKERTLAELWAKILCQDVKGIGRRDDFLALGGDSLAAIRLVSAARSKNLELTTQSILRCPILENMAELATISNVDLGGRAVTAKDINHDSPFSSGVITLRATDFQEWAVSVGALNGGWIDHLVYDFSGRLDLERLEQSCRKLVEAHPILGTIYRCKEDRVYMEFPSEQNHQFDVHQVTIDQLESKSNEIYAKDRIWPLGRPIVRFDLIKASPTRHRLVIKLSHAHYDGFCARTFGEDLRLLYFSQPLPRTLPFYEYARKIQDPKTIQDAEMYWQDHLNGSRMPKLVDRSRSGTSFDNTLDGEFIMSVAEPNLRRHGISTAAIVKAAWALTISSLSQSNDVVFGDFIAGRQVPIPDIETVVGPCVNFMPVRVRISSNLTNLELIKQIQADLVSAIPHESLGFKHIIQNCTNWGRDERFSSIVNYVNIETASFGTEIWIAGDDENRLEVDSIYEEQQHDKTDLWLLCLPGRLASKQDSEAKSGNKTLELHFRYSKGIYQTCAIKKIASIYCEALNSLATALDALVSIPQILDKERSLVPRI